MLDRRSIVDYSTFVLLVAAVTCTFANALRAANCNNGCSPNDAGVCIGTDDTRPCGGCNLDNSRCVDRKVYDNVAVHAEEGNGTSTITTAAANCYTITPCRSGDPIPVSACGFPSQVCTATSGSSCYPCTGQAATQVTYPDCTASACTEE